MNVKNCPRCGNIFNRIRRDICPNCAKKEDQEYELVRDYIYDHPKVDVQTLHVETEVPLDTIMKFLREDRLVNLSGNLIIECESCGSGISSGRYCESCKSQLEKEFSSVGRRQESKESKELPKKKDEASFHFMRDRLNKKR